MCSVLHHLCFIRRKILLFSPISTHSLNEGDQEVNGQLSSFDIEGALTGNIFLDAFGIQ